MTTAASTPDRVIDRLAPRVLVDGLDLVLDLERSHGRHLVDARTGVEYLDFFGFFASNPLGMNPPDLTEPAFLERLARVAVNKPSNSDVYTEVYAHFVETLDRVARPACMTHFFFVDGGALAVENAMKAAFDWRVKRAIASGGGPPPVPTVLHLEHAFHGRSGYTLSVTNTADPRKTRYFPTFDWPRIASPAIRFPLDDAEHARLDEAEGGALEAAHRHLEAGGGAVAAILVEPIQGEGGDRHFRRSFLAGLRALADRYDALLIFDEVQTGAGTTGRFWAFEHFDVEPDLLAFSKKMQIGGIMAGPRIDQLEDNVFRESSRINSTWGGHLVDMARAAKILEVIERDGWVANARATGARLLAGLEAIAARSNGRVTNARGRGLFAAIDLEDGAIRDRLIPLLHARRMLALPCGTVSLRFRPALTVEPSEIDDGLERLEQALAAL